MSNAGRLKKRVVIVGGGITGLSSAYFLQEQARARGLDLAISLFESQPQLGGKILTEQVEGFTIEGGPDSFLGQKPWAAQLARRLGLGTELEGTNDAKRKTYVINKGRLTPLPDGVMLIIPTRFWPFVTSPLISLPGKLRMGLDLFIPARPGDADESLADFIRRRLGKEALAKIAEPLMSGIHVSDPEQQSLLGTFPRFRDMEKKYGSLTKAMLAQRRAAQKRKSAPNGSKGSHAGAAPSSMFLTLKGGLSELVQALERALLGQDLRAGWRVTRIERPEESGYQISVEQVNSGRVETLDADALILSAPAYVSGQLVAPFAPELARMLAAIRYVSTATISLAYRGSEYGPRPKGFGFVVPRHEGRKITACTWVSTKFNHRAPEEDVLLRCFVGGPGQEEMVELSDEELMKIARAELADLMGVRAEPLFTRIYRWRKANPQYDVGHLERVGQMHRLCAELPGLYLTGSAFEGVGIPDCVHQAEQSVEKALAFLQAEQLQSVSASLEVRE